MKDTVLVQCADRGASVGQGHGEKPLLANQSCRGEPHPSLAAIGVLRPSVGTGQ